MGGTELTSATVGFDDSGDVSLSSLWTLAVTFCDISTVEDIDEVNRLTGEVIFGYNLESLIDGLTVFAAVIGVRIAVGVVGWP